MRIFFITESKCTTFALNKANNISAISSNFRKPKKFFSISSFKGLLIFTRHHIMKGQQNFCVIISLKKLQNFCSCRVSATSDHERGCRISAASDHLKGLQNFCSIGAFKGLPHFRGCRISAPSDNIRGCRISAASIRPSLKGAAEFLRH